MPGRLNPGNHDDAVPSAAELKETCGNLRSFKKRYLDQYQPAKLAACKADVA